MLRPATTLETVVEGVTSEPRVGYLIYRVERRLRTQLDEALARLGMSTPEYVALSILRDRDGLSGAQLARWTFVTPQAVNQLIASLERRRLVRRRPDPCNARVLRASVTRRGLRLLERCDATMDELESEMLWGLDPATVETVRAALSSCAHALESSPRTQRPREP